MTSLPTLKSREIVQALIKGGFYVHHQKGSHDRLFHHQRSELKVTVPIHGKDMPEKTLRRIVKQADLTE
jgi:predicted RNA binding protein YcfA (HicA-like mRNA interferase family)